MQNSMQTFPTRTPSRSTQKTFVKPRPTTKRKQLLSPRAFQLHPLTAAWAVKYRLATILRSAWLKPKLLFTASWTRARIGPRVFVMPDEIRTWKCRLGFIHSFIHYLFRSVQIYLSVVLLPSLLSQFFLLFFFFPSCSLSLFAALYRFSFFASKLMISCYFPLFCFM